MNLRTIQDSAANLLVRLPGIFNPLSTLAVENPAASPASTVITTESLGAVHKTIIDLNALAVSLSDANVGGGTKIYNFPEGLIRIHGGSAIGIVPTTTSVLASTLNASKTLSTGVGSVITNAQASGTLATTEQDVVNQFSTTSSATINVAGTGGNGKCPTAPVLLDGTAAAAALYLNFGVPTNTDIDGDATITVTGRVVVLWSFLGDY